MTTIYFIRHCEAAGNTKGVLQGRSDSDISGNSAKQLELVSLRLRNVPFSAIYSSPLRRAYKTAQAINRYHDLEIQKDEHLIEIDMGDWEGRSWADIEAEGPEMLTIWNERPGDFQAPGGEAIPHVAERMWQAALAIAQENDGKTVCAVSHGCAIRCLLCRALGKPVSEMGEIPWCDNTAVTVIEFEDGRAHVVRMNDASHIPPELSVYRRPSTDGKERMIKDVAP
ncbi:MAG TPA: histidine phosphatase family protein [Armatimonadota bacterium]|nr:histidine phosphatase family protein [Armatimonadota bacterium]